MYNLHNGERNNHWQSNHSLEGTRGMLRDFQSMLYDEIA